MTPRVAAAVALLTQLVAAAACAQQYPVKPVRIVASEAGGGGDFVTRILKLPEVTERLLKAGIEPVGTAPEALGEAMSGEIARVRKVVQSGAIRAE